jgi:TonB family protein
MLAVALVGLSATDCGNRTSDVIGGPGPTQRSITVAQGKHVVIPTTPFDRSLVWGRVTGIRTGYLSPQGTYHAPLTLPTEPNFVVEATNGGWTETVLVQLVAGPVEDQDCQAPGQPDPRIEAHASPPVEQLPEAVLRVSPTYPDLAREAGVDGTVILKALVCACGDVMDIGVEKSIPMLDQAAIDAVRQWYFIPATNDGEPVATWVTVPVKFSLH